MNTSLHGILADRRELTVSEFFTSSLYGFEISDTASVGLWSPIGGNMSLPASTNDATNLGLPSATAKKLVRVGLSDKNRLQFELK